MMKRRRGTTLFWIVALALGVSAVRAADEEPEPAPAETAAASDEKQATDAAEKKPADSRTFERVRVVGSPEKSGKIPGSVAYLDRERLSRQSYDDVHRILSQVAGVNIQEEDGYGLRPNIGMRGTGVERSQKITLMEDGVLIAPAPYSAPSAYYFPTAGRMEGVEVRKGTASVQHGPYTNGGALNLMSTSIPSEKLGGVLNLAAGVDSTLRGRAMLGGSTERFGWMVESYRMETDGFKQLDGGGPTGFDLQDYLVKLRVNTSTASVFQMLELKAGKTLQEGAETYLGLTQEDFDRTPFRRYAGSQMDTIDTDHGTIQARYLVRPSSTLDVTTTVYRNDFFRNWRKLQSVSGAGLDDVLGSPELYPDELAILRGDLTTDSADDALELRNNRRDYFSQGVQAVIGIRPGGGSSDHDIEVGLRYHQDEEDRFQEEDGFRMTADGRMELTSLGDPGSQANRVNSADAYALFVQDVITTGKWVVTPGVRFESIDYTRVDYADPERQEVSGVRVNEIDEVIPGVGATYSINRVSSVFGGVHRGFSPPGPGSSSAEPERSVNYELGYRRADGRFTTEVVGFFNDYSNMLGACTVSSGCNDADVGDVFDAGEVNVAGLEASFGTDLSRNFLGRFRVPLNLTYTYTRGEFLNSFSSDYDPWGDVKAGDQLPYLPRNQASLGVGLMERKFSTFVNLIYTDAMRTEAGQGPIPPDTATDSRLVLDLTVNYFLRSNLKLFALVRNLTDEVYVVARRPAGARPGIDRQAMIGLSFDF